MKRTYPEQAIQKTIVQALRRGLPSGWEVIHVANQPRNAVAGRNQKAMGARSGWPDVTIFGPVRLLDRVEGAAPTVWFGEVKSETGVLEPEQIECHDRLRDLGYSVGVWRSLEDAVADCLAWSLPLRLSVARAAA